MPVRRLLAAALLAGILTASAACSDVTGPQKAGFCQVNGNGQTVCTPD